MTKKECKLKQIPCLFNFIANVLFCISSIDSYPYDPYCSAQFSKNLPASPKHLCGVFNVFDDFHKFANWKSYGLTLGKVFC